MTTQLRRSLVLALALVGCGDPIHACTQIGCDSTMTVEIVGGATQEPMTVDLSAPGGLTRTATCSSADGHCKINFGDFQPISMTVRVSWSARTAEMTVSPHYTPVYPNGRDCGAACQIGEALVTL